MHVLLVEDQVESLYPFSVLHCSWELRCSRSRMVDSWKRLLQADSMSFHARPQHLQSFFERFPSFSQEQPRSERCLIIYASLLPSQEVCDVLIQHSENDHLFLCNGEVVARSCSAQSILLQRPPSASLAEFMDDADTADTTARVELPCKRITELWELLDMVAEQVGDDVEGLRQASTQELRDTGVHCIGTHPIWIGEAVEICPSVVLDTRKGAIVLDHHSSVMAHSVLMGPCSVGEHSLIKAGAKIYHNTVIGEWSKVGGEVENSIVHAYANKQHEGFLGHSFLSEWVNLGADTNTSDLKNTYCDIRITRRSKPQDTGRIFLGLLCGDHTKSGINTMFTTGCVCGIHSNVFGAGYSPAEIPSYAWGAITETRVYPARKALAVARTVMARRSRTMTPTEESLMIAEFDRQHPQG